MWSVRLYSMAFFSSPRGLVRVLLASIGLCRVVGLLGWDWWLCSWDVRGVMFLYAGPNLNLIWTWIRASRLFGEKAYSWEC
jgi:hypothetical protein